MSIRHDDDFGGGTAFARRDAGDAAQGLPVGVTCPSCSYDLRGLTSTACPECGFDIAWRNSGWSVTGNHVALKI